MKSKWVTAIILVTALVANTNIYASGEKTTSNPSTNTAVAATSTAVDINTADLMTLETIKGLGATKAQSIIDYRTKNGKFTTTQDLEKVPGIGPKLLEKIQPLIKV